MIAPIFLFFSYTNYIQKKGVLTMIMTVLVFLIILISILATFLASKTYDYKARRDYKKIAVYTAFAAIIIAILDFIIAVI